MDAANERINAQQIIHRLTEWVRDAEDKAELVDGSDDSSPVPPVGMLQLAEHVTAIRHDVRLLTKALRGSEERGESALLAIQAAIEQLRMIKPGEDVSAATNVRGMIEVLVDVDDGLRRERRALQSARQFAIQEAATELGELRQRFDQLYRTQPWWRRAICQPWYRAFSAIHSDQALERNRKTFDALLEGHDLLHGRLVRGLRQLEILKIECVGRIVDPLCMNVVEVVSDPARPAGLVLDEVRAGYYWKGSVFRFAEVKAVASQS